MARRRSTRRPDAGATPASICPLPRKCLDYRPFFPIKSIFDIVRVLHSDLNGSFEPNLAFWSVMLGVVEARLTGSSQVVTHRSSEGAPDAESRQESALSAALCLPVIEYADVKTIFDKFKAFVKSEAGANQRGANGLFATANYDAVTRIKDCIWKGFRGHGSYEKAHLQFLTSYATGYHLDSFGCAATVVAAGQLLKYADMHLALSEGHVWLAYGHHSSSRIEVSWHGKNPDTRKSITDADMKERWLYSGGKPLICDRLMELAMLFSVINPTQGATTDSLNLMFTQYCLLHVMYTSRMLSRCPQALVALAEAAERLSAAPGLSASLFINCERIYKSAVRCARKRCADVFLNPCLALAAFCYRQGRYLDSIKCWTAAARVLGRFTYTAGDDDEPYKDFNEIVGEKIPHILTAEPSASRSPVVFSYVIRIVDSLCKWEEGSNCAVLHAGWAKNVAVIASKFDFEVRRQVKIEPSENEQNSAVEKLDPAVIPPGGATALAAGNAPGDSPEVSLPVVVVQLTSHKMSGLRNLLVAEKVSTEAIQLQMASQVGAPARKHGAKRLSGVALAEDARSQPPSKRASIATPTKPAETVSKSASTAASKCGTVAAVTPSPEESHTLRADVNTARVVPDAAVPAVKTDDNPSNASPAEGATTRHETIAKAGEKPSHPSSAEGTATKRDMAGDVAKNRHAVSAANAGAGSAVSLPENAYTKSSPASPCAPAIAKPTSAFGGGSRSVPLSVQHRGIVKYKKPNFVKSFASARGVCVRTEKGSATLLGKSPKSRGSLTPRASDIPARFSAEASPGSISQSAIKSESTQQPCNPSPAIAVRRSAPALALAAAATQQKSSTGYEGMDEERKTVDLPAAGRQSAAVVTPASRGRQRSCQSTAAVMRVPGVDEPPADTRSSIPRLARGRSTDAAKDAVAIITGQSPAADQPTAVAVRNGRDTTNVQPANRSTESPSRSLSAAVLASAGLLAQASCLTSVSRRRALRENAAVAVAVDPLGTESGIMQTRGGRRCQNFVNLRSNCNSDEPAAKRNVEVGADKGNTVASPLSTILEENLSLSCRSHRRPSAEPDQMSDPLRVRVGARRIGRPSRNAGDSSVITAASLVDGPGVNGSRKRKLSDSLPSKSLQADASVTSQDSESQVLLSQGDRKPTADVPSATIPSAVPSISLPQPTSEGATKPSESDRTSECAVTANGDGDADTADNNPVLLSTRRRQMALASASRRGLRSPELAAAQRARMISQSLSNGTSVSCETTYQRGPAGQSQQSDSMHQPRVADSNGLGTRCTADHLAESIDTHRKWGRRRRSSAQSSSSVEESLPEKRATPAFRTQRAAHRPLATQSSDDAIAVPLMETRVLASSAVAETPNEGPK